MDELVIAGRKFQSRLLVGTGKFSSIQAMLEAMEASGSDIVTVALRRVDIDNPADYMLKHIDRHKFLLLPNTSGARDCEEAVRLARLARAAGCEPWIKLEVTPDPYYLLPDPIETLQGGRRSWSRTASPSSPTSTPTRSWPSVSRRSAAPRSCRSAPPSAPTRGFGRGSNIAIIIEQAHVPVVVDAGLGAPSHAAEAMEMGADAVLVNTALAVAREPGHDGRRLQEGSRGGARGVPRRARQAAQVRRRPPAR